MPSWLADDARPVEAPASSADALAPALDQHVDQHVDQAPALASSPGDRAVEPMDPSPVTSEKASSDAQWPDPLLAEYAPYIPTPLQLRANAETPLAEGEIEPVGAAAESTDGSLAERPDVAAVDDMPALVEHEEASFAAETAPVMHAWFEQSTAPAIDAMADSSGKDARGTYACGDSGARVSATLDRLAERVRSGEIDVSSIAAEAPDAAVLASVLAALLGGSGSR